MSWQNSSPASWKPSVKHSFKHLILLTLRLTDKRSAKISKLNAFLNRYNALDF